MTKNISEAELFAYDKVLYPNYLHTQTHPDRLATMTKFFGVNPKPVENCRVLELGCGTGSSLLSFAYDLPGSDFVGIDLSEKQIELGKESVKALGLKNLSLRQANLMDVSREEFGEFDYIIAHGIYSWVPEPVRDKILSICEAHLAEQGVAFVSYNAYPGAHLREIVRGMMQYHTKGIASPTEKVKNALGFLKFIADNTPEDKPHFRVLEKELEYLGKRSYENIFHDELEEVSHPVYFQQFVSHADKFNLQFVTEVEHFTNKDLNYPKEVVEQLLEMSGDKIALEQNLDFLNNRRFRQTLLCRKELNVSDRPDPKVLREVRIATALRPESEKPELSTTRHEKFVGHKTEMVEINHPLTKAALFHLGKIWARSETFDEIVAASRRILSKECGSEVTITERDEEILTEILFQIFCSGMVRLHVHEPAYTTTVGEKPVASPVARWQVRESYSVATLISVGVHIEDELGRQLLMLLDGTRDRGQLISDLTEFINSENFDEPSEVKKNILRELPEKLEENLQKFADLALLVS